MSTIEADQPSNHAAWIGPTVVAIVGIVMLVWSWGTWPDPVIDFGREIYVPWRLSEGEVLYRDIVSYFNGPLSPYLHALVFSVFGVSLRALVVFNIVVIALLVTMMYHLLSRTSGRLAATTACASFLILFAFAQYLITGNFNFVCPYSYELPHGITLTVALIACLDRWNRGTAHPRRWLALAGMLLGLVFLTKAEVFAAAVAAAGAGIIATRWVARAPWRRLVIDLAVFGGCAVGVIAFVLLLLMLRLTASDAMRALAGAWLWTGDRHLLNLPYFKELAGTHDIGASIRTMLLWTGAYVLVFGIPIVAGLKLPRARRSSIAMFLIYLAIGWWMWQRIDWNNFIRPLPLMLGIALAVIAIKVWRRCASSELILPLVLVVWSLGMLAKMPLNAHIYHYGFALAMPATIVGIVLLIGWLPRQIDRLGGNGTVLRAAALAVVVLACYVHVRAMDRFWSTKTYTVGQGADAFRADIRGVLIHRAVEEISRSSTASETLVALPEGLLINYLARRVNPTGQLNFTPPAIIMYGEGNMLAAFEQNSPNFIAHLVINTSEYGASEFGIDYALKLGDWIVRNYAQMSRIRFPEIQGKSFEIELLKRK